LRNVSIGDSLAAKRQLSRKTSTTLQCYIMLALPIIGFFVFTLYPILWSFRWSLFAYNGVAHEARFVGLDNFISVFTKDAAYWTSWKNTILFAVLKLAIRQNDLCVVLYRVVEDFLLGGKHAEKKRNEKLQ